MIARMVGTLLLASCLTCGTVGLAHAGQNGQGQNQGGNSQGGNGSGWGGWAAPELDPGLGTGALALLVGGLMLLEERRRPR
jgi:hypothetical protein